MHDKIAIFFKALADPSRLRIFHSLMIISSSLSISQIGIDFNMTRQGVTKHIKILEQANLISISSVGRERFCKAEPNKLKEIKQWLEFYDKFWDSSLSNLGDYLDSSD